MPCPQRLLKASRRVCILCKMMRMLGWAIARFFAIPLAYFPSASEFRPLYDLAAIVA